MPPINAAYLAHLRVICEHGSRPAVWDGMGPDPTLPERVARRLEQMRLIERRGDYWFPTREGKHAVGRVK